VDWSKVPHEMVEKRVLSSEETASWCADFADWCDTRGITRGMLDETCQTNGMGGHWTSRASQPAVPTPEMWALIKKAFNPPVSFDVLVGKTEKVPVAEWETPDIAIAGRNRTSKPKAMSSGEYSEITGYVCACSAPDAPTRPSVVLDPFGGTGTVAGVARKLGRIGISLDLSMDYTKLAKWRVYESGAFSKSEQRTWRDRQLGLL
jgi:hypothetical protein